MFRVIIIFVTDQLLKFSSFLFICEVAQKGRRDLHQMYFKT